MSFDDLITYNGYRDSVTMSQLEAYLDMDSTDEKMHKKMRLVREKEAKEFAKKQQKEIAKKQKDEAKLKKQMGITGESVSEDFKQQISPDKPKRYKEQKFDTHSSPKGKGMQLGRPKKLGGASNMPSKFDFGAKDDLFSAPEDVQKESPELDKKPKVDLKIEEMVNCDVTKFSDVSKLNVKGTVSFTVEEENKKVSQIEFIQPQGHLFKNFKVGPEIDKQAFKTRGMFIASDEDEGFIPGNEVQALIYKYASDDETQLPFEFSIFTSKAAGGKIKVALEIEFVENTEGENSQFDDIRVKIKVEDEPKIMNIENSEISTSSGGIVWSLNGKQYYDS